MPTYCWKAFNEDYNFFLDFTSIGGVHKKLCFQSCGNPNFGNFKITNLGVLGQKDKRIVAKHREYYKGGGCGFFQIKAMVNLVSSCVPAARSCTKNVTSMH